jgi:hypothetical protein
MRVVFEENEILRERVKELGKEIATANAKLKQMRETLGFYAQLNSGNPNNRAKQTLERLK